MWMSVLVHPQHMAKPSPTPLFHLLHNVVDTCAPTNFFVSDTLFPPYSQDSPKTPSFKASEPALKSFVSSPCFRGVKEDRAYVRSVDLQLGLDLQGW